MSVTLDEDLDEGGDERADKDLEAGMEAFYAIMAEDTIGRDQSSLRRGGQSGRSGSV